MDKSFDKIIHALVMEVAADLGIPQAPGITKRCRAAMELRLKGWVADRFNVCQPGDVLDSNHLQHSYMKQGMDGHDKIYDPAKD